MTTETGTDLSTLKRGRGVLQIVALLAILYTVASIQTTLASFLLVCSLLLSALSMIRPIPSLGLPTRRYAAALFFSVLLGGTFAVGIVANRSNDERLASLRASDPDAYLEELEKRADQGKWLDEIRILAPERYLAEKKKFDAEQARIAAAKAEKERRAAELAEVEAQKQVKENIASMASASAEDAEKRRYGLHCVSIWDQSHPAIKRAVKSELRAPDSFEHVSTDIFPVSEGRNRVVMTYRAQNGFGGMNVGRAIGSFDNKTCDARLEVME